MCYIICYSSFFGTHVINASEDCLKTEPLIKQNILSSKVISENSQSATNNASKQTDIKLDLI